MGDEAPPPTEAPSGVGSASPLERLLRVQSHDTTIDQLRHRRATLSERAQLRDIEARLDALELQSKRTQTQREELAARQSALEQQIEASKSRRADLERRMFGGQTTAPRELQAMDEEVKHLVRHIAELEDREIEIMEALEPLDGDLQVQETERDSLDEQAGGLREEVTLEETDLDREIEAESGLRLQESSGVPPDLMSRYEQLRKKLGGTGAARLVNGACGGCHLTLPAMEVDRIRRAPPDELILCDQCGRILVR